MRDRPAVPKFVNSQPICGSRGCFWRLESRDHRRRPVNLLKGHPRYRKSALIFRGVAPTPLRLINIVFENRLFDGFAKGLEIARRKKSSSSPSLFVSASTAAMTACENPPH
jgi:hypothetical protein